MLTVLCLAAPALGRGAPEQGATATAAKKPVEFFATDFANGELLLFDVTFGGQNKPKVKSAGAIGGLDEPWGLDVDPVGRRFAYVANSGSDTVAKVDVVSRAVVSTIPVGKDPRGVVFTPDGTLVLVVNNGSKSVSAIDPATDKVIDTIRVKRKPLWIRVEPTGRFAVVNNLGSNSITVLELEQMAARTGGRVTRVKDVWHFKKGVCRLSEGLDLDYQLDDDAFFVTWTCRLETAARTSASRAGADEPVLKVQSREIGPGRMTSDIEVTLLDWVLATFVGARPVQLHLPRRQNVPGLGCVTPYWTGSVGEPPQAQTFIWNGTSFGLLDGVAMLTPFSAAGNGQVVIFPPGTFPVDAVQAVRQAAKIKIHKGSILKDMVYHRSARDLLDLNCYAD